MSRIRKAYQARAEQWLDPDTGLAERYVQRAERKAASPDARYPLTAGQHILHLLLTPAVAGSRAPGAAAAPNEAGAPGGGTVAGRVAGRRRRYRSRPCAGA